MSTPLDPLAVYCPVCLARPTQLCEEIRRGWIVNRPEPHPLRIRAAEEVSRD
jgi:hypothetical protein